MRLIFSFILFALCSASAQTSTAIHPVVRANGDASLSITPDQARIRVSVTTQAATAQDAASQNANTTGIAIAQITQALAGSGTVQTVSYTVNPVYTNQGGAAVLTGYTVTNSLEVVLNNLALAGKIVDTAVQSGATRIDSLQFTLKDDSAARSQALRAAAQKARSKADAMASSLGMKLGAILVIQESGAVVLPVTTASTSFAAATPIQPGPLTVTGNVTIEVELN